MEEQAPALWLELLPRARSMETTSRDVAVVGEAAMGYRPPKGVRPPQLEGKRTGRPKGSRNYAKVWADILWAYEHRYHHQVEPPNPMALWCYRLAYRYPDELAEFLEAWGQLGRGRA
jgi:hypothetical protein